MGHHIQPQLSILAAMTFRTAYITGGASGIGLAVAHALHNRGMRIAIADINLKAAQEAARQLEASAIAGQKHLALEVDVSSWDSQVAAFSNAVEIFNRIDIVIVNAGVGEKVFVPNDGGTGQGFVKPNLQILDVDLSGFLYMSALALQQMRRQGVDDEGLRGRSELRLHMIKLLVLSPLTVIGTASVCGFYCVPSQYTYRSKILSY